MRITAVFGELTGAHVFDVLHTHGMTHVLNSSEADAFCWA